ncbi:MAG: hypothetical protein ACI823_000753 [Chitinophagales bacterium]|jgi:hypothetical protein
MLASAIITSHGQLLNVERRLFDGLYSQHLATPVESGKVVLENSEAALLQPLLAEFQDEKLSLLTLPSVALKIS